MTVRIVETPKYKLQIQSNGKTVRVETGKTLQVNLSGIASATGGVVDASYVCLGTNATLTDERVLTGTANQITVTDAGAGSTVTLSTPQDLDTGADVTFGTITVTGTTTLNTVAYTWPAADGSANAVLTTDGAGTLSWGTAHPETVYTSSTTTTDGIATTINITPALSDDTVYRATVKVLARCTASSGGTATVGDVWDAVLYATFRRSDTLTRVNWRTVYYSFDEALASPIEVIANDTTKLLQLEVQGFAGDTILWEVICELQEVST